MKITKLEKLKKDFYRNRYLVFKDKQGKEWWDPDCVLRFIETERKEAVEGFAKWLGNKQDKRSGFVGDGICPCCTTEMLEEAEQYLTQTKGDKE